MCAKQRDVVNTAGIMLGVKFVKACIGEHLDVVLLFAEMDSGREGGEPNLLAKNRGEVNSALAVHPAFIAIFRRPEEAAVRRRRDFRVGRRNQIFQFG